MSHPQFSKRAFTRLTRLLPAQKLFGELLKKFGITHKSKTLLSTG
jgi:hypothetical protein